MYSQGYSEHPHATICNVLLRAFPVLTCHRRSDAAGEPGDQSSGSHWSAAPSWPFPGWLSRVAREACRRRPTSSPHLRRNSPRIIATSAPQLAPHHRHICAATRPASSPHLCRNSPASSPGLRRACKPPIECEMSVAGAPPAMPTVSSISALSAAPYCGTESGVYRKLPCTGNATRHVAVAT